MIQRSIETKTRDAFSPFYVEVLNESHMHSGPAAESHFNVTLVSDSFEGLNLVKRHQAVYKLLAAELAGEVHALALHLYTEKEWEEKEGSSPQSPNCLGGSKSSGPMDQTQPKMGTQE